MQTTVHEMRHALGDLRHNPGFTVLAVVILGFGLRPRLFAGAGKFGFGGY